MDEDVLMGLLGDIINRLSSIESDVSSIRRDMPDSPDNYGVEQKLDRIIELLEEIAKG